MNRRAEIRRACMDGGDECSTREDKRGQVNVKGEGDGSERERLSPSCNLCIA